MQGAITMASTAIEHAKKIGNDELIWRSAAIGVAAARTLGDAERERALRTIAVEARTRLRTTWGTDISRYDQRPDLLELRKASGLED